MGTYDWLLVAGVLYTGIGSDLLLNWGAGLITGKRLRSDSPNFLERQYYRLHAVNDPSMRATPPVSGPDDRIPAWNHALAVANGTIVIALEVLGHDMRARAPCRGAWFALRRFALSPLVQSRHLHHTTSYPPDAMLSSSHAGLRATIRSTIPHLRRSERSISKPASRSASSGSRSR